MAKKGIQNNTEDIFKQPHFYPNPIS